MGVKCALAVAALLAVGAQERFGVGRPATRTEIAAWDTDVNGAGDGLPAGRGTAAEGAVLYGTRCASCHGPKGEGGSGSQLVRPAVATGRPRRNIASHWPFAPPLFDYIRRTMPPARPWSLTNDETYSLVAFLLAENGIIPRTLALDAAALRGVRMPAKDRFMSDDRRGGQHVK